MANEFKILGLKPIGGDGYFQNFNVEYNEILSPCSFSMVKEDGSQKNYKLGNDFVCRGFTGSGKLSTEVVFAGYGFSYADIGFDEYKDIDVNGKIVMMFKQTPNWKLDESGWNQSLRYRAGIAFSKGAVGIIFVSKPNDSNPQKPIGSVMDGDGEQIENFPMIHADIPIADEILMKSGKGLKSLQTDIDDSKMSKSFETSQIVSMEVNAKYEKNRRTMNVAGLLEGTDSVLKNEYLIIGAHLDHVVSGRRDIFSGRMIMLRVRLLYWRWRERS